MANRVVVTGMGAITPLGNNVETFWEGLKKGKAATAPITSIHAIIWPPKSLGLAYPLQCCGITIWTVVVFSFICVPPVS